MKKLLKKLMREEEGQSMILIVLVLVFLLGLAAIVIDLAMINLTKTELQTAADAAALAGAAKLTNKNDAIAEAEIFAKANGFESDVDVTTPYGGNANQIEVVITERIEYTFAKILGFTDGNVVARAVAEQTGVAKGPFNYTLFSGDPNVTLYINGSSTDILGDVHSNEKLVSNGGGWTIDGSAEAVSTVNYNGSHITVTGSVQGSKVTTNGSHNNFGQIINEAAPFIPMPDFSDTIAAAKIAAQAAKQYYNTNKTFNAGNLNVDSPIFVEGNLTVNGSGFSGKGMVYATGNITFNGSSLKSLGSSVAFYSINGNITLNGANAVIDGLVYAPKGNIKFNGANQTVNGRVIGNTVTLNGSGSTIHSKADDLDSLPLGRVRLVE